MTTANVNAYESKVETELRMRGFHTSAWTGGAVMNTYKFTFGTMQGAYGVGSKGNIFIISVDNTVKGNGDFAKVMDAFEDLAHSHKMPLFVVHLWNERLGKHLTSKRGYVCTEEKDGYHVVYVNSIPDNVMDKVRQIKAD